MKRSVLILTIVALVLALGTGAVLGQIVLPNTPPGGHLFAFDPPNQFPPDGTMETVPLIGQVGLDLDACPGPIVVDLAGYIEVTMDNTDNSGPETLIEIEIVELSLTGRSNSSTCGEMATTQSGFSPPPGALIDPTNQPNGAFPAALIIIPHPVFEVSGVAGVLHAEDPLELLGRTVGWPPIGIELMPDPADLPMPVENAADDPIGELTSFFLLPTTPADAFMASGDIDDEFWMEEFRRSIDEAVLEVQGDVVPLQGQINDLVELMRSLRGMDDAIKRLLRNDNQFERELEKILRQLKKFRRLLRILNDPIRD